MKLHNLSEELVSNMVEDIFAEEDKKEESNFCTCHQCKLDVMCYVLNRIEPEYIVSGRGIAHMKSAAGYQDRIQKEVDIAALINEGIKKISQTTRPHHVDEPEKELPKDGFYFNFPTIIGRLFNGENFEPLYDVTVSLKKDDQIVKTIDANWDNPYTIVKNTPGNFQFWPFPVNADKTGEKLTYEFELVVECEKYEPFSHFFELEVESEEGFVEFFQYNKSFKLKDMYLFPK